MLVGVASLPAKTSSPTAYDTSHTSGQSRGPSPRRPHSASMASAYFPWYSFAYGVPPDSLR
eukprot:13617949-Alexandrium_andersonii.AAC.1